MKEELQAGYKLLAYSSMFIVCAILLFGVLTHNPKLLTEGCIGFAIAALLMVFIGD